MPKSVRKSPPVEERKEREAELARERSWIVMHFSQSLRGSPNAELTPDLSQVSIRRLVL